MGKRMGYLMMAVFFLFSCHVNAQDIASAEMTLHNYFTQKSSTTTDKYNLLMSAYEQYVDIANMVDSTSVFYKPCRKGLVTIFEELEEAVYDFAGRNDVDKTVVFAKAYVDLSFMYIVSKDNLTSAENYPNYPTLTVYVANTLYKYDRYQDAIPYFQAYLSTEDQKYRKNAFRSLVYCYYSIKNFTDAKVIVCKILETEPNDWNMLSSAIELCNRTKDEQRLEKYLDMALLQRPNDTRLLLNKAILYAKKKNYVAAAEVYEGLDRLQPNNIDIYNGMAFNNYNAGVTYYKESRKAQTKASDKTAYMEKAKAYFTKAVPLFDILLENNPYEQNAAKARASCFAMLRDDQKLKEANQTLAAMNKPAVKMGAIPTLERSMKSDSDSSKDDMAYQGDDEDDSDFLSDVDMDIPLSTLKNMYTYAVIIGNENYKNFAKVDYALNDAGSFKKYCQRLLGVPEKNVRILKDASLAEMQENLHYLDEKVKLNPGKLKIIFYYAGHGIPNPATGESYLLPSDASGQNYEYCLSLEDLYKQLEEMDTKNVTVFLDACFSGGSRNGDMMFNERYVYTKPKEVKTNGNLVVFSATSGEQTSMPYDDQQHGFFTYYLLKSLKESNGSISFEKLAKQLKSDVDNQALDLKGKHQTPQVKTSVTMGDSWKEMNLLQ